MYVFITKIPAQPLPFPSGFIAHNLLVPVQSVQVREYWNLNYINACEAPPASSRSGPGLSIARGLPAIKKSTIFSDMVSIKEYLHCIA